MSESKSIARFFTPNLEYATLGGGCFWCTESAFSNIKGVLQLEVGYAGSPSPYANYQDVCGGQTGLVEVVHFLFDPQIISYRQLLQVFFMMHNPTTRDQQGADVGSQYRSVVYWHSPAQMLAATEYIAQIAADFTAPIVTDVLQVCHYTRAEDEHQHYFERHPYQGYCQAVIAPKVAKIKATLPDFLA